MNLLIKSATIIDPNSPFNQKIADVLIVDERIQGIAASIRANNAKIIDAKGISFAIKKGIEEILIKLQVSPDDVDVRLDGSLYAPKEYLFQKTIIKGDVTEPVISLASIMAKVTRDKKMVAIGKKHLAYGFETHKGYGTQVHQKAILENGLTPVHRKSFCKKWC